MNPRGPEEQEPTACSSTLGTATSSEVLAEDLRQFTRSPHPYHRSRRLFSRTPSEQGDRLQPERAPSYSKASRTPSDSGTEADDESTGVLRGLPAPPVRPHKGLRAGGNGAGDSDAWLPSLQPWPSLVRSSTKGSRGSSGEEAGGKAAERTRIKRRARVEILRRLLETALLLSVGVVVLLQRDARSLAWAWKKGRSITGHWMSSAYDILTFCRARRPWPLAARPLRLPPPPTSNLEEPEMAHMLLQTFNFLNTGKLRPGSAPIPNSCPGICRAFTFTTPTGAGHAKHHPQSLLSTGTSHPSTKLDPWVLYSALDS